MQEIAKRYVIDRQLGAGGMGVVYLATDAQTQQQVAVKRLKIALAQDDEQIERFIREGKALRELDHPNIIKMLDAIHDDEGHAFIMEYADGGSLGDKLNQQGKFSVEETLRIALDLSDALIRAHRLDIIHRDLKPDNVLLAGDGTPRLTDFGIAQMRQLENLTEEGVAIGTLPYMSPEAIRGEDIDLRTDIWSFGILLYEMLTGRHPFADDESITMMYTILVEDPPEIEEYCPDIPLDLTDLIYRMLEKDRMARIPSVRHVGAAIEDLLQGRSTNTNPARVARIAADDLFDDAFDMGVTPHNLPAQTTPFIGRESELTEIARLIGDQSMRLITILAPGGMGKTRLALESAERQLENFADGVFAVELAGISEVGNISNAIADAVGLQFQQEEDAPPVDQQLRDFFESKTLLLVLDNFEHLLEGAEIVSDLLAVAPQLQILATSRERLNLQGEHIFRIEGMNFPDWETPDDALEYSAVKLFMQSARRIQPNFELQDADLPFVARICRLVQGMPLGIVLAAAWLDMLPLDEIASEMQSSLDFLETDMRDMPERHRSMRAVFDYSWRLLTEKEQAIMASVSVFRGGFSRQAAQAVAQADLRTLAKLVNKSLLRRDAASGRYFIHELTRQYAAEQLDQRGQGDVIRAAHSAYYVTIIHEGSDTIQRGLVTNVLVDMDNVIAAIEWAIQTEDTDALKKVAWSFGVLNEFYVNNALFLRLYEQMHAIFSRLSTPDAATWQAVCLVVPSDITSDFGEKKRLRAIAMPLVPDLNDSQEAVMVLANLAAHVGYHLNDMASHDAYEEQARGILEKHNYTFGRQRWDLDKAHVLINAGDLNGGEAMLNDLLRQAEAQHNYRFMLWALDGLKRLYNKRGQFAQNAENDLKRLRIVQQIGLTAGYGDVYASLGFLNFRLGNIEKAHDYYEKALFYGEQQGDKRVISMATIGKGIVAYAQGDYDSAEAHFAAQIETDRAWGQSVAMVPNLQNLAFIKVVKKDYRAAIDLYQEGLALAHDAYPRYAGTMHGQLGGAYLRVGEFATGLSHSRAGLEAMMEQKNIPEALGGIADLGYYYLQVENYELAAELMSLAYYHDAYATESKPFLREPLAACESHLGADAYQAAVERGKNLDVMTTAEQVLQEMDSAIADLTEET